MHTLTHCFCSLQLKLAIQFCCMHHLLYMGPIFRYFYDTRYSEAYLPAPGTTSPVVPQPRQSGNGSARCQEDAASALSVCAISLSFRGCPTSRHPISLPFRGYCNSCSAAPMASRQSVMKPASVSTGYVSENCSGISSSAAWGEAGLRSMASRSSSRYS